MSSIETVKSFNTPKIKTVKEQIEALKAAQTQTVEGLAQQIEPLAQAMARLTESARTETLRLQNTHRKQLKALHTKTAESMDDLREAHNDLTTSIETLGREASRITDGVDSMKKARKMISLKIIALALVLGLMIGTAAGAGSWHLLKAHYIKSKIESVTSWTDEGKARVRGLLL